MLSYKLHQVLIDIVEEAFPKNVFSRFFIEAIPKEMKTIHGRYYPSLRKIQIFNLSRPTGHIISTSIHEVSHHIDYNLRKTSDHSKKFYEVMYLLLKKALGMGLLTKEDILSATDSHDQQRLIKYFGDIKNWSIPAVHYKTNLATIKVRKCYPIKDALKEHGYKYSSVEQTWEKVVDKTQLPEEQVFLNKLISSSCITIESGNQFHIQAVYYISVLSGINNSGFLAKNGYIFNGYNMNNDMWNKKIFANDLNTELSTLKKIPGIKVKVQGK